MINKYEFLEKLLYNKRFLYLLLFIMIFFTFLFFRSLLFIVLLLTVNALLGFIIKPFKFFLAGFELATLTTVLVSLAYGGKIGFVIGGLAVLINLIAINRISFYNIITVPFYMILGALIPYFSSLGIMNIGIGFVLLYNFLIVLPIIFFFGANLVKGISYIIVNILFNIFIFSSISLILLKVMM